MLEIGNYQQDLVISLNDKTAVIGVVGLGYVGLPLAVEKALAGYQVIGFDVDQKKVDSINQGINYIADVDPEHLRGIVIEEEFMATSDFSNMKFADVFIICVPTPLDQYMQPDITYVRSAAEQIAKHVKQGALVILESTTYPGTTQEIIVPLLEKQGFKIGEDIFVAYSPERVDPGNKTFKTRNTPKVVGGVTTKCTEVAATLYRNSLEAEVYEVSSPAVAEMEKIFENTFRNINIALANEMSMVCNMMGIDVWEVIDAAKTKPYGFMAFYPGPGLGGHCIPIDPFYLTWKAREFKYHTRLIETAGEINNAMPSFVVGRIASELNAIGKALNGSKIAILGVAYKKDIEDVRESPVLQILHMLDMAGVDYVVVDPYVKEFKLGSKTIQTVELTPELFPLLDMVVLTTDHSDFDYELIGEHSSIIFDTRNAFKGIEVLGTYIKL